MRKIFMFLLGTMALASCAVNSNPTALPVGDVKVKTLQEATADANNFLVNRIQTGRYPIKFPVATKIANHELFFNNGEQINSYEFLLSTPGGRNVGSIMVDAKDRSENAVSALEGQSMSSMLDTYYRAALVDVFSKEHLTVIESRKFIRPYGAVIGFTFQNPSSSFLQNCATQEGSWFIFNPSSSPCGMALER